MQLETFGVFYDLAKTRSLTATARHFGLTRKAARRQFALAASPATAPGAWT